MPFANDDPTRQTFASEIFASEPKPVAEILQFMPSTAPYRRIKTLRDANAPDPNFTPAELFGAEMPGDFWAIFDEDLIPVEPFNEFLFDHCYQPAKYQNWQKTQAAYADDLCIFLAFLRRKGIRWEAVGRNEIKAYVREFTVLQVSTRTKLKFAPATTRRRVGTVFTFYDWAVDEKKLIPVDNCFGYANRRVLYQDRTRLPSFFAGKTMKLIESSGFNQYLPTKPDPADQVRPIPADRIPELLDTLGPRFVGDDDRPRRNRLIAETALLTGMRISEVCSLQLTDIQRCSESIHDHNIDSMFPITVYRTKGRHHRDVLVPGKVIKRLDEYALGERHNVIEAALDMGKFGGRNGKQSLPRALFINGLAANVRDLGRAVSTDTPYRAFHRTIVEAGLTTTVHRFDVDLETGLPLRDDDGVPVTQPDTDYPAHSFHDLRHTYAVNFYAAAIKAGRPDAVKKLQALLGHRHLETTQKTYLRHVELGEAIIADLHDELFKRLLDGTY